LPAKHVQEQPRAASPRVYLGDLTLDPLANASQEADDISDAEPPAGNSRQPSLVELLAEDLQTLLVFPRGEFQAEELGPLGVALSLQPLGVFQHRAAGVGISQQVEDEVGLGVGRRSPHKVILAWGWSGPASGTRYLPAFIVFFLRQARLGRPRFTHSIGA
jgi:hypothetical protein